MISINMGKAFIPRLQPSLLQLNHILAETAPEAFLAVATDATKTALFADIFWVFFMVVVVFEVGLELFAAVEDLAALVFGLVFGVGCT